MTADKLFDYILSAGAGLAIAIFLVRLALRPDFIERIINFFSWRS